MTTNKKTEYMEPMTDEQIKDYADFVIGEMSEKDIISKTGMNFIKREDNIPTEEDQQRITDLIEEIYTNDKTIEGEPTCEGTSGKEEESKDASKEETGQQA